MGRAFVRTSFEKIAECSERHKVELNICSTVESRNVVNNNMSTDMSFIASAVEPGGA
jgi:hypothetical protein